MTPGSNHLAIGVSLMMRDGFTQQANQARNAMNALYTQGDRLARQQAVLARNSNAAGAAIGVGLIGGMAKMYKEGADFNYLMKYISINADATGKSFDRLSNKALEVGMRTMFSSTEVAEGMKFMAQAGLSAEQITSSIDAAANLAQATMSGLPEAADLMNRMASAFQIDKTSPNMMRISDVLGVAANKSETDISDLGEAMKYSQATAHRLGMTLEETAAAVMTLAGSGLRGSMGGTAFENMTRELAKAGAGQSDKKNGALAMLGMTTSDIRQANGEMVPFALVMERIGKGLQGMGKLDRQNVISNLLNVRGARADLLATQLEKYKSYLDSLNNSGGFTEGMAGQMMETDKGKIDIMMSNWEALRIQLGGMLATVFTPLVIGLTKVMDLVSTFANTNMGKVLLPLVGVFIIGKTAMMAYRAIQLSVKILQMDIGNVSASTGATNVSWWNRMTVSANAYNSAQSRAKMGMMGRMGMVQPGQAGSIIQNSRGQWVQVQPTGMHRYMAKGSSKVRLTKMGNVMGRGAMPAALGGMALSTAGGMMGEDSTTGKWLSGAGNVLGMAGTGAMIGSMGGPMGTAIGGIIGGVGALMYELYTNLTEVNDVIKTAQANHSQSKITSTQWAKQIAQYQSMTWKERGMLDVDTNMSGSVFRDPDGRNRSNVARTTSTTVILQLDGLTKLQKTTEDSYLKEMIELGY